MVNVSGRLPARAGGVELQLLLHRPGTAWPPTPTARSMQPPLGKLGRRRARKQVPVDTHDIASGKRMATELVRFHPAPPPRAGAGCRSTLSRRRLPRESRVAASSPIHNSHQLMREYVLSRACQREAFFRRVCPYRKTAFASIEWRWSPRQVTCHWHKHMILLTVWWAAAAPDYSAAVLPPPQQAAAKLLPTSRRAAGFSRGRHLVAAFFAAAWTHCWRVPLQEKAIWHSADAMGFARRCGVPWIR